jgi:hypothetical protein
MSSPPPHPPEPLLTGAVPSPTFPLGELGHRHSPIPFSLSRWLSHILMVVQDHSELPSDLAVDCLHRATTEAPVSHFPPSPSPSEVCQCAPPCHADAPKTLQALDDLLIAE